ncbi:hypothetical protein HDIA_2835 [Hartmannibacter diazotrophicus]|uniref:Uncharacterized protein n=1 Tax=Hartmannibacter diazotrophicus TaxID=1482074 RepID=A0A2C9D7X3_9HYPH|nr:hypothetical protein [Hartmannibacter diazotrophicus]SON56376.1 hypothetical protein HDIA_2835 [Hartmannibacter diazotrophicus]
MAVPALGKTFASVFAALIAVAGFALPARADVDGPAAAAINDQLEKTILQCFSMGEEKPCKMSELFLNGSVFYGDYSGDGVDDAVAFLYMQNAGGGNSFDINIWAFKGAAGGFAFDREVQDVFGTEPRNAKFSKGKLAITTTMPKPGDPRCCPTGKKTWTIGLK